MMTDNQMKPKMEITEITSNKQNNQSGKREYIKLNNLNNK